MENEALLKEVTARAQVWLGEGYDQETRNAVQAMLDNEDKTELIESFYRDLEFGTGGLRGIIAHEYHRIDEEEIFNIIKVDQSPLLLTTGTENIKFKIVEIPKDEKTVWENIGEYAARFAMSPRNVSVRKHKIIY